MNPNDLIKSYILEEDFPKDIEPFFVSFLSPDFITPMEE